MLLLSTQAPPHIFTGPRYPRFPTGPALRHNPRGAMFQALKSKLFGGGGGEGACTGKCGACDPEVLARCKPAEPGSVTPHAHHVLVRRLLPGAGHGSAARGLLPLSKRGTCVPRVFVPKSAPRLIRVLAGAQAIPACRPQVRLPPPAGAAADVDGCGAWWPESVDS